MSGITSGKTWVTGDTANATNLNLQFSGASLTLTGHGGNITPDGTNTRDIGTTSLFYANAYLSNIYPKTFAGLVRLVGAGCGYTTISAAMTAASAGDVILVLPGTYSEQVTFSQDNLSLVAFGGRENTVITQADTASGTVNFSTKSGCLIKGFTVNMTAATAETHNGILSSNDDASVYNYVDDCEVNVSTASAITALAAVKQNDGNLVMRHSVVNLTSTYSGATLSSLIGVYGSSAPGTLKIENCEINVTAGTFNHADSSSYGVHSYNVNVGGEIRDTIITLTDTVCNYPYGVQWDSMGTLNIYDSNIIITNTSGTTATALAATRSNGSLTPTINSYRNTINVTSSGNAYSYLINANSVIRSNHDSVIAGTASITGTYSPDIYMTGTVSADADESKFAQKATVKINGTTYYIMMTTT